ncbi:hypothetical protein N9891_00500 [bacterium]|nr:hypothetical protein [bacterium]
MKIILTIFFSLFSSSLCHGAPELETVNKLLLEVRKKLPVGWSAKYEPEYLIISVTRNEEVVVMPTHVNPSGMEKSKLGQYEFCLRLSDKISDGEYQRKIFENDEIRKKRKLLYDQLVDRGVKLEIFDFAPETDEDRVLVDRYEKLEKQLIYLPPFYFDNLSLRWAYGGPNSEMVSVIDDEIRSECRATRASIIEILSTYVEPKVHEADEE